MKAYIAEFVGAFTLIFIGVGAIAMDFLTDGSLGLTGVALAHGLAIGTMVAATANTSGGHLNPAVTIGLLITGKIKSGPAVGYIISQCLGGIVAAVLIKVCVSGPVLDGVGMGTPALGPGITAAQGLVTEIVLTFFLMFVIYGAAVDKRASKLGPLFIGLTIVMDILMGGPISGAAMNPARHLGPALLGGGLQNIWIYWVGPILGAATAALLYNKILEEEA